MDDKQRLNLQEMIKQFDADDNTAKIRQLKHSRRIRDDVEKFVNLSDEELKSCFIFTNSSIKIVNN